MDIKLVTIEDVIYSAVLWGKERKDRVFYGCSDDGGFITLRASRCRHQGELYKSICVMNVTIPEKRRRVGLYSGLLSSLDELSLYGIRWHDSVQNEYLAERHRKHGYFSHDGSFYKIIGAPYPAEIQNKMNEDQEKSTKRIIESSKSNIRFKSLKKKRKVLDDN